MGARAASWRAGSFSGGSSIGLTGPYVVDTDETSDRRVGTLWLILNILKRGWIWKEDDEIEREKVFC